MNKKGKRYEVKIRLQHTVIILTCSQWQIQVNSFPKSRIIRSSAIKQGFDNISCIVFDDINHISCVPLCCVGCYDYNENISSEHFVTNEISF